MRNLGTPVAVLANGWYLFGRGRPNQHHERIHLDLVLCHEASAIMPHLGRLPVGVVQVKLHMNDDALATRPGSHRHEIRHQDRGGCLRPQHFKFPAGPERKHSQQREEHLWSLVGKPLEAAVEWFVHRL